MLILMSPCERHASGNVGDRLQVEVTRELIEAVHGPQEFETFFKREDLTSRLSRVNRAAGIVLVGFEIDRRNTRPGQYRIAEDLTDVDPPIVPTASTYSFFPGTERRLRSQSLGPNTLAFVDEVAANCPDGQVPVRDRWVGRVLDAHGYDWVLTGDPGWYDVDAIGEPFHEPEEVDQLVMTPPRSWLFVGQARTLLQRLAVEFPDSDRIVSLHTAPEEIDRQLCAVAREHGWRIRYASHDTSNIAFYRESDLHVGYRLHGHLAHLRLRRPSLLLSEDARGRGLTETLGGGGIPAFEVTPARSVLGGVADAKPVVAAHALAKKLEFTDLMPRHSPLKARANRDAVPQTLGTIRTQLSAGWPMLGPIRATIDETYETGMRPFIERALA